MYRGTFAIVDQRAIQHNVARIKKLLYQNTRMMVAVKANGYGHGAVQVAQAVLQGGATDLCVASLEEALQLRNAGISVPILVLGPVSPRGAQVAAAAQVAITLTNDWSHTSLPICDPPLQVHLKIDTGMTRLGFRDAAEVLDAVRWMESRSDVVWAGLFTHLAAADVQSSDYSERQLGKLETILQELRAHGKEVPLVHAANSAGAMRDRKFHFDMVRVGISAYGYRPSVEFDSPVTLQPALNLYSFITRVATVEAGQPVSYGGTFVTPRTSRIATLPVGYADGYPRWLSNRGQVVVHGQFAPVVGRICMDQLMIDVTDLPQVEVGDCVTLFGRFAPTGWTAATFESLSEVEQTDWLTGTFERETEEADYLSLDVLAELGQTISYELMCAIAPRVPRLYVTDRQRV